MITLRRVYDAGENGDQYKIFIDRIWPRGISKEKAGWDEWMKTVSPSPELRKWFDHQPDKFEQFRQWYIAELSQKPHDILKLKQLEKQFGTLTLLYAARDEEYNNAVVLKEYLQNM